MLGLMDGTWEGWKQATCMPNECFCEKPTGTLLQQPIDTWTNMAFSVAGVIILLMVANQLEYQDVKKGKRATLKNIRIRDENGYWFFATIYAFALLFLGLTSGFYHASLTFIGQFLDNVGMYLIICWAFSYNIVRLNPKEISRLVFFIIYLALIAVFAVINIYLPDLRRYAFFGMILLYIVSQFVCDHFIKPVIYYRYWVGALLSIAAGFTFWILDIKKILCHPTSWFQGHGIWHSLDALSAFLLYVFYLSEGYKPDEYDPIKITDIENPTAENDTSCVEQEEEGEQEMKNTSNTEVSQVMPSAPVYNTTFVMAPPATAPAYAPAMQYPTMMHMPVSYPYLQQHHE
jgi:hypothetical protein